MKKQNKTERIKLAKQILKEHGMKIPSREEIKEGQLRNKIINNVLKENNVRNFVSQFIYHGHGDAIGRLSKKKDKICDGCEGDIDAIMDEFDYAIDEIIERYNKIKRRSNNEKEK